MNRVVSSPPVYEYLRLDFKVTRSLIETATLDSDEVRITISKLMCYTLVVFVLIAGFEAIVINGTRLALNTGLWVLNTSNFLVFGSPIPEVLEPPAVPVLAEPEGQGGIAAAIEDEQLPELLSLPDPVSGIKHDMCEEFLKVFETLATASPLPLPWGPPSLLSQKSYLEGFRERTKHLHPLQVMGFLLEKNSKQRKFAAEFIDRTFVGSTFIDDTLAGFANPIHSGNTVKYIVSFAEKADVPADAVRGFLFQNPPHLKNLIHYILRK